MNRIERYGRKATWPVAFALAAFVVAGCGGGGGDGGARTPAGATDPVGAVCAGEACVNLGTASNYVILAQAGVTNVPNSAVTGNVGVSPIDSTAMTGFANTMDASNTFSTSAQVTGKMYAADYAAPTPSELTTAVGDSVAAYNEAAGRPAGVLNLGGGNLSGQTLTPGTYTWGTTLNINGDITLSGTATDVWIFQVAGNLNQAAATKVILAGGALSKNVFWQVGGGAGAAIGTTAQFAGIIITGTQVVLNTGASVDGRLYTGEIVTLDQNTVTRPAL